MIFEQMGRFGEHEQVVFFQDLSVNLKGIIAIHSTRLGPALGGCRMWSYASENEALEDVLKLSRGMTYKAAVAGLELGGGKSIIIGEPQIKTPQLFQSFGRFVDSLNGNYITAEDVGTSVDDMRYIRQETRFVTGLPHYLRGSGDPSPFTARSTLIGMKVAVLHKLNKASLNGLHVVVQGVGHVGWYLATLLLQEGCKVSVCDISSKKTLAFKQKYPEVKIVSTDDVYDVACDIFSPCALGGVITPQVVSKLKCSIIAGAANNQLDTLETEIQIQQKGILYVPDFVINAGGLINVFVETTGCYSEEVVLKKIENISDVLTEILNQSVKTNNLPTDVAISIANSRLQGGYADLIRKKESVS